MKLKGVRSRTKDTLYVTSLPYRFLLYFCLMLGTVGRHVDFYQVHLENLLIFIKFNFFGTRFFWGSGGEVGS